jgi:hypothetical protein
MGDGCLHPGEIHRLMGYIAGQQEMSLLAEPVGFMRTISRKGYTPIFLGPRGCYLTGLVEPCGALPRKCLFVYSFIHPDMYAGRIKKGEQDGRGLVDWHEVDVLCGQ